MKASFVGCTEASADGDEKGRKEVSSGKRKQIAIIITITITNTIKPSNHQTITITITIMDHHHWTSSFLFKISCEIAAPGRKAFEALAARASYSSSR